MHNFTLVFQSRGIGRIRYHTIKARDENQANMLGEARASKYEAFIGIAPVRETKTKEIA